MKAMNTVHAGHRTFRGSLILMGAITLASWGAARVEGQYSDDLKDIKSSHLILGHTGPGAHEPTPIGDLGHVTTVVDLRGFVPMSFLSVKGNAFTLSNAVYKAHALAWFKIPTKKALLLLYTGKIYIDHIADDSTELERQSWESTRFLSESDVSGETAAWTKIAYDIAQKDSKGIFDQLVGGNFSAAEPTTIFFTQQSVFVVLSFKYDQWSLGGQYGQALVALEFSRSSKRYKTLYYLYSTTTFSKSAGEAFSATAPYIAKAIEAYFTGQ